MTVALENLPARKPIADATAALDAAQADHLTKRRDVNQLEQERPAAEWRQAEAISEARAAGKPDPKTSFVDAHDKLIDSARMELKVATLAEKKAHDALDAVRAEHEPALLLEVGKLAGELDARWDDTVKALTRIHGDRSRALTVGRELGAVHPAIGTVTLDLLRQAESTTGGKVELPQGAATDVIISVPELLGKLASLGQPEPEKPKHRTVAEMKPHELPHLQRDQGLEAEKARERDEHRRLADLGADVASNGLQPSADALGIT
jgi:hypothetical protein